MSNVNVQKWPVSSRIFHWISAILLLVTWLLMLMYQNTEDKLYIGLHKGFWYQHLMLDDCPRT